MIYLEPLIRRGKEVCVIMVNVGQFPSSAIAAHTIDPNGHSQVSSARGAPHLPISRPNSCQGWPQGGALRGQK